MTIHGTGGNLRITATILVVAATSAVGCGKPPAPAERDVRAARIERGKYLVQLMGCNDCHTPLKLGPHGPEPDMARMLSGHPEGLALGPAPTFGEAGWLWAGAATNTAFAGPWGLSYARNITSDEETGIGAWTEEMFVNSMKTGKQFGAGRPILPPMPWQGYSHATDEDLKAIFAYLMSTPPIKNLAPESVVVKRPPGSGASSER